MRTIRTRGTVVAGAALLAALSLTACSNDNTAKAAAPAGEATATAIATGAQVPAPAPSPGTDANSATSKAKPGASVKSSGKRTVDGGRATCTGEDTKVFITKVAKLINHLLLTVTNTGSRPCDAFHAPFLRFDDDQAATRIIEDSIPQAVVTLGPGQSAYASIALTGPQDSHRRTAKQLTVYFAPRSDSGSTGAPATLALPAGTSKDDGAAVTYWQSAPATALSY